MKDRSKDSYLKMPLNSPNGEMAYIKAFGQEISEPQDKRQS